MSTDLQTQIRHLARHVESSQVPVTVDEVRLLVEGRDDTEPLVGPGPRVRGVDLPRSPWPAVVAAVVVLLLFGVFAWVFPGDSVPPADTAPPPFERDPGYYATSEVPVGFVLQDMNTLGVSRVLFLREFEDTWIPSDGGFTITGVFGRPAGLSQDPDDYLGETLEAVPGSTRIEVAGRSGVLFETEFSQDGLTAPIIWVLGMDGEGGVFEVAAVGMRREEVLAVADGVHRVSVDDFLSLGSQITWDVRIDVQQDGFAYSPPSRVTDLADEVDVALGVDLLLSRLAGAGQEGTVITTEDGEIVESFGRAIRSTSADLYLEVPDGGEDAILSAYPGSAELAPQRRDARVDRYVEQVQVGSVLSEDPYVIQAAPSPEPRFDTSELGDELPLVPATSIDVLPDFMFSGPPADRAAATPARPVIIIGTAHQPASASPPVTVLVWFTETGVTCEGTASDDGMGSGCGFEIMSRFGLGGPSTLEEDGVLISGEVIYTVPVETSVVQIVTASRSYWQRPTGGYGVVSFGDTIEQPTVIVAFDVDGNEIGEWVVGTR